MVSHTTADVEQIRIDTVLRGGVSAADSEYAKAKVAAVTAKFHVPILFARVKLTRSANPSARRPALAQVNVEVNGQPIRAQVAAESMREAVDLLVARLQSRLHHAAETRAARRTGGRRDRVAGNGHDQRPEGLPDDPEVVRHKSYSAPSTTSDEAAAEMELMDYDFHLFTDSATGQDSVVYRSDPYGHQLARLEGSADTAPAPVLSLAEAKERLAASGEPFVFFADQATGRGSVLYRRFDGDYGLITPARAS
jgi:ribosome-associated translation inhibitor RaiA